MAEQNKQYYGIKFPFTANNLDGFFVDLNTDMDNKVASEIAHVILTPKRSRIRKPDFGTDLIKYLFENNDDISWDTVEEEVRTSVKRYVPNVEIEEVSILTPPEEPHVFILNMTFAFHKGKTTEYKQLAIKL